MKRILFANIGWMMHYHGQSKYDTISGGGSYRNDDKHETFNFQNIDGWCYGYVETVKGSPIKLSRIDPSIEEDADCLDDVLVIWTARNPEGGTFVVGWYQHSTVYRTYQDMPIRERNFYSYNILARYDNCTLLLNDDRVFKIKRARAGLNKGFMGQSNVWYADSDLSAVRNFRNKVIDYVLSSSRKKIVKGNRARVNVVAKRLVEETAVDIVSMSYEQRGYKVVSVEKENLGWDLIAKRDKRTLRLEVKGLASEEIAVRITPNEYSKMNAKNNADYRLCVVTNTLTKPALYVFIYDGSNWVCEDDDTLIIDFDEQVAAIGYVK